MSPLHEVAPVVEELSSAAAGPRRVPSLRSRQLPLAEPHNQLAVLAEVDLREQPFAGEFEHAVQCVTGRRLRTAQVEIMQLNLGKLCNMSCRHCHVDAGPDRWHEVMDRATIDACLAALDRSGAHTVDLTGGAPELNPHFRDLVGECVSRKKRVIDRCNLTVLLLDRNRDLPQFLAERGVEVVCSLPHVRRRNTDAQRGDGTFEKSLRALRLLNDVGYGEGDPERCLTLMVNPVGAFLAGDQGAMERDWKRQLADQHDLRFDRLIAINNMPIARYLEWLQISGNLQRYMELLVASFNPATVDGLMCRSTLSVSWDGRIYDCDFNQMLELESRGLDGSCGHIADFDPQGYLGRTIVTGRHCFGCTAGAGSSCGGAIE